MTARIPFDFNVLGNVKRSYPLVIVGAIESGSPFLRMFALTRILSLFEVGFVSILTAFSMFFELSTDIAMYRFVFSVPKQRYHEALAAAHALSVARGVVVSILALCAAPIVAWAVSLSDEWMSFAALAPTILLRSFEHLAPRVAERDFRYWPQVKTTGLSLALSLIVVVIVAVITRSHVAIIASAYAQVISSVVLSRWYADAPYRLDFRGPLFQDAFRFAYPLLANGLGLSIALQGDRFVVAALFDLKILALYSVIMLAVIVPMFLMARVLQSTILARLFHAGANAMRLRLEVRLASSVVAILAAAYAGGVVLLMNPIIALVFGPKFHAGGAAMILLGVGAFVRLVRSEPFTSLMLNEGRTKRLAASNVVASSSLGFMVLFSFFTRSVDAVLAARLLGETASLVVTLVMARRAPAIGRYAFSSSTVVGLLFTGAACLASVALEAAGDPIGLLLAASAAYGIAILLWAMWDLRRRMSRLRAENAQAERATP